MVRKHFIIKTEFVWHKQFTLVYVCLSFQHESSDNMRSFAIAIILISVNYGEYSLYVNTFDLLMSKLPRKNFSIPNVIVNPDMAWIITRNMFKLFIFLNWRQNFSCTRNFSVALKCFSSLPAPKNETRTSAKSENRKRRKCFSNLFYTQ